MKTQKESKNNGASIGCLIYFLLPAIIFLVLLYIFQKVTGLEENFAFEIFIAILGFAVVGYAIYDSIKK